MKFHLSDPQSGYRISSYDSGLIVINQQIYRGSLIVSFDHIVPDWSPRRFEELTAQHLNELAQLPSDLIILGTGSHTRFVPGHWLEPILSIAKGFETMSTPAACRTYNVLLAEGRSVSAALMLPPDEPLL